MGGRAEESQELVQMFGPGIDGAYFLNARRRHYGTDSPRGAPRTTEAVRHAIQHSPESLRSLVRHYGVNPKTIAKWRKRTSVVDRKTGPSPRSIVFSLQQESVVAAFRRHTLLPLDDCLYALQATIPELTRSSLHRCLQRHDISRLPEVDGDRPRRNKFKTYPIGYIHIDIAEVRPEQGKLCLFVAIDRHRSSPSSRCTRRPPNELQLTS